MADITESHEVKTVYLLVEAGEKTFWNRAGVAFLNRDGSLNMKLDLFPQVIFNIRNSKDSADEPKEASKPKRK